MEQQREQAPAPTVAAPASVPAPVLPVAGPAGPSALSVPGVLALQRSAGNAAVASVLARQPAPAPAAAPPAAPSGPKEGPLAPGEISVDGGDPKPQGSWGMSSKVENGRLYMESPEVHFDATLEVPEPPEKRKIPSTTVGFIQTVESADRKGIYTRDGTPGGTPVANKHLSASDKRDVRTNMVLNPDGSVQTDPSGNPVQLQKAPAPWYDDPSYLDEQQRKTQVTSMDRTKTSFPLELEHQGKKGRLAQTAGADRFQMAVSAKPGDAPAVSLKSMDWETPWTSTVDPSSHKVTGTGAVWVHPSDVPLGDQKEPTGVVNKDAIDWVAITTVADAKALGAQQCLALLPLARQYDAESYEAMATALRELNPLLGIDVGMVDGGADTVQVEAEGARGVHARSVSTPGVAAFHLLDFFDPNDLHGGAAIKVRVTGPKGNSDGTLWAAPFGGASLNVDGIPITCRLGGSSMGATAPATGPGRPASGPPPAPPPAPPAP